MLKTALTLLSLLILIFPIRARAQEAVTLQAVEVDLWPEYDRSSMLVIYKYILPSSVSLPFEMVVRIPAEAGSPSAVASRQADGALFNLPYETQPAGEWLEVRFRTTTAQGQVEYYDPRLATDQPQRSYVYRWAGDYAVDSLVIQVQQPRAAQDMRISPSLGSGIQGSDGLVYYNADQGAMPAGQPFSITINYTKEGSDLSASTIKVQPSGPIADSAIDRAGLTSFLPWLLGALGLLLIAGGGYWYWRSGREPASHVQSRRGRRRAAAEPADTAEGAGSHVYCHQCGKRAAPGDRFCRTCGTQLRLN